MAGDSTVWHTARLRLLGTIADLRLTLIRKSVALVCGCVAALLSYTTQAAEILSISAESETRQLLAAARAVFQIGRYKLAFRIFEQALTLDPANVEARNGEEQVEKVLNGDCLQPIWLNLLKDSPHHTQLFRKLTIILPEVNFRETTLPNATSWIEQMSRQPDGQSNPADRGLEITLKPPVSGTPPHDQRRMTLQLKDVPLLQALRYVAAQTGMRVKVGLDSIWLEDITNMQCDDFVILEYNLTPEVLRAMLPWPSNIHRPTFADAVAFGDGNVAALLKANGVKASPSGTRAVYLPQTCTLTVSAMLDDLERIDELIDP